MEMGDQIPPIPEAIPEKTVDDLMLPCTCSSLGHVVRFSSWDYGPSQEIYVNVSLERTGFWRRLGIAWKYVFGRTCNYDASEVIIRPEDVPRIRAWLDKARGE